MAMAQNWIMMISELHRYQGVSYKSDIIVISGETQHTIHSYIMPVISNPVTSVNSIFSSTSPIKYPLEVFSEVSPCPFSALVKFRLGIPLTLN